MTAEGFLLELQRIINSHPKRMSHTLNSENAEYGDQLYYCKNMLYCFDTVKSSDCTYTFDGFGCVNCMDIDYCSDSQLLYDCVDAKTCFNSDFLEYCSNVRDSSFSAGCRDCHDVFGCVNLTGKSFCIFNRQLTEEDYKQKVTKYKSLPPAQILATVDELKKRYPFTQTRGFGNQNSPFGNYVYTSKDCYMCFDATNNENCGYLFDSGGIKYSYDGVFSGESELAYEFVDSSGLFNSNYVIWSSNCQESSYLLSCMDVKNSLGCVNLEHKQYCILNRQFEKEEYEKISAQILEDLRNKNLGWGNLTF